MAELIRNGALPIGGSSGEQTDNGKPFPNRAVEQGPVTYVLVSWSMPRTELLEIMDRMQGQNAAVVFRGIPKSTTMLDALEQMNSLTVESKSEVSVLIDPFLFQRSNTEVVPTVVKEEDQKLIAKVSGLSTTDYLEQAISEGKSGDLGVRGPTLSILEPDFMSLVQERIEKLDFEEMKTKALARYWKNKKLEILPTATEHDVRHVDASVILPSDITSPNGDVVARAGSINPLKLRKFTQRVVFIDATSSWQVEFAKNQVEQFKSKQRVTVITTNVDADDGWSTFGKTSDYIGARIGLLDEGLKNRFQIQKIPSVLTANDSDFIVEEFPEASAGGAQL
ncbi:Type-F conjugative transfer system pilin assembly protein [compost metagenome]